MSHMDPGFVTMVCLLTLLGCISLCVLGGLLLHYLCVLTHGWPDDYYPKTMPAPDEMNVAAHGWPSGFYEAVGRMYRTEEFK